MNDNFLSTDTCDRCGKSPLPVRMMSWFTEDTICLDCVDKEEPIKAALRAEGIKDAMEACGYIPKIEEVR